MRRNESGYNQRSVTKWYIGVTGMTMRLSMNRVSTIISHERDKTRVHGERNEERLRKRERKRNRSSCTYIQAARSSGLMGSFCGASHFAISTGVCCSHCVCVCDTRFVLTIDRIASLNSQSFISSPPFPLTQSPG